MQCRSVNARQGIVLAGADYDSKTEFSFNGFTAHTPAMIGEATRSARELAPRFAGDPDSRPGRSKSASRGRFSIENRDSTAPFITKIRVISTLVGYDLVA